MSCEVFETADVAGEVVFQFSHGFLFEVGKPVLRTDNAAFLSGVAGFAEHYAVELLVDASLFKWDEVIYRCVFSDGELCSAVGTSSVGFCHDDPFVFEIVFISVSDLLSSHGNSFPIGFFGFFLNRWSPFFGFLFL